MKGTSQIQKDLLDELGLSDLSQKKKEELAIKMTEIILKRIFLETMEKLNEESKSEYAKLIKKKADLSQLENFLKSKIKNYDAEIQKIIDDFKKEMMTGG